ncbi:hypothetical protein [Actinokineospora iranica]|uniref:hypothetical protein n=1 Tax=Actinokineospora iranica TaxID=1271860 RepID=UPI00111337F6|nr:hypothetical protein [Actinokineospora iranica]
MWNATPRPGPLKAADVLGPREDVELPGLGIDGVSLEMLNWGTADITFAFRDVEGQWWRRVSGGEPARVEASVATWRVRSAVESSSDA